MLLNRSENKVGLRLWDLNLHYWSLSAFKLNSISLWHAWAMDNVHRPLFRWGTNSPCSCFELGLPQGSTSGLGPGVSEFWCLRSVHSVAGIACCIEGVSWLSKKSRMCCLESAMSKGVMEFCCDLLDIYVRLSGDLHSSLRCYSLQSFSLLLCLRF